jgi:nucleoside 2-deoxyribosyltransferase
MKTVYIASKVKHAAMWIKLRKQGYAINSTWIDEVGKAQKKDYAELAVRCLREIQNADVLLLFCKPGELLKGTLIETGAALALGKEVFCVGNCHALSRVFKSHPNWKTFKNLLSALQVIKG